MSNRLRSLVTAALVVAPFVGVLAQDHTTDFKWSDQIGAGKWVRIHNLNGEIRVAQATGDKVEVTAVKHWRRGNPDDVTIVAKKDGDDVMICALWDKNDSCEDSNRGYNRGGSRNRDNWNDDNDVAVDFTVLIPKGTRLRAASVNGTVVVSGATSDVDVSTVNGRVDAEAGAGPFTAASVNGSVRARVTGDAVTSSMEFTTVNGSVVAELPNNFGADITMTTVNGSLRSDYDITVHGRIDPHRLDAHVGAAGGPRIRLTTVNGDIDLRKR
jgi:hypothetical protein